MTLEKSLDFSEPGMCICEVEVKDCVRTQGNCMKVLCKTPPTQLKTRLHLPIERCGLQEVDF